MFDWFTLLFSSFWIVGLAIILAFIGYYDCVVKGGYKNVDSLRSRSAIQTAILAGSFLLFVGLLGLADTWWERIIWGIIGFLVYLLGRQNRH